MAQVRRRSGRVFRLRKQAALTSVAKGLLLQGSLPQAVRGHRALGLAPSTTLTLRRQAKHAVAGGALASVCRRFWDCGMVTRTPPWPSAV
eukprot:4705752-Pyramimonas_sp.AAC.1